MPSKCKSSKIFFYLSVFEFNEKEEGQSNGWQAE
jgi:hypothetical protein